jgi:cytoskeletal protein CcmA (bactofilin family)
MAFFAQGRERGRRVDPPPGLDTADRAPREVEMFDREQGAIRGAEGLTAFLGKGSRVTGTLVLEGPSRLEGHVEGQVSARDTLTVGESAVVNARIEGTTIVIQGTVTGDIVAQTRLELRPPGKVTGDVTTPSLVINEGAVFEGRCSMRSGESVEETRAPSATLVAEQKLNVG